MNLEIITLKLHGCVLRAVESELTTLDLDKPGAVAQTSLYKLPPIVLIATGLAHSRDSAYSHT